MLTIYIFGCFIFIFLCNLKVFGCIPLGRPREYTVAHSAIPPPKHPHLTAKAVGPYDQTAHSAMSPPRRPALTAQAPALTAQEVSPNTLSEPSATPPPRRPVSPPSRYVSPPRRLAVRSEFQLCHSTAHA